MEQAEARDKRPVLEVFFMPKVSMHLAPEQLRQLDQRVSVPADPEFPFHRVRVGSRTIVLANSSSDGWIGRAPESLSEPAEYLWLLNREGGFLYRERFWEDDPGSVIPGGIGIYHVIGKLILLVRFLNRFAGKLEVADETIFRLGISLKNIKGRYLGNELSNSGRQSWIAKPVEGSEVSAGVERSLIQIREGREDIVATLAEEIAWSLNHSEMTQEHILSMIITAPNLLGQEYTFPSAESV